jgi:competence protein ComEC
MSHQQPTRSRCPALWHGLAAVVGISLAESWPALAEAGLWLIMLAFICFLIGKFWHSRLFLGMTCALFIGVHGGQLEQSFRHPWRLKLLQLPAGTEQQVTVQARLYPWLQGSDLDASRALAIVEKGRWQTSAWQTLQAQLMVELPTKEMLSKPGLYELTGPMSLLRSPQCPGQYDPAVQGLRNGIIARLKPTTVRLVKETSADARYHFMLWAQNCRDWMRRQLIRGIEDQPEASAVILAMALGATDDAGEEIEDAFRDSGTLHIFAVSGLHVVMLAYVLSWLLRWLGLGPRRQLILLLFLILGYAYVTGWRASAARAAWMTCLLLLAPLFSRKASVQNSLGVAALLLLLADTQQLFQAGFQLSFIVLWAIAGLTPWLVKPLRSWMQLDAFIPPLLASRWQRLSAVWRQKITALVASSLAAWLGSLPLTLWHFHSITPVGLVANWLLIPASGVSLMVTCASLVSALLHGSWLQSLFNQINAALAWLMVTLASFFADLPAAHFSTGSLWKAPPAPAELRIFHVSRGGLAQHLRVGDAHWLLDVGHEFSWRQQLRPYLQQQGVNQLQGIILSHSDGGHIQALPRIHQHLTLQQIFHSPLEPWPAEAAHVGLSELHQNAGLPWSQIQADQSLAVCPKKPDLGHFQVLYPSLNDLHDKADDRALILQTQLAGWRVLWMSDAGFITEKALLQRYPQSALRSDVLIRSCHSHDFSSLPEFLLAVKPRLIIHTQDQQDLREKTPATLLQYAKKAGVPCLNLETSGSIQLDFFVKKLHIHRHREDQTLTLDAEP